jgi:HK97 family phage portal protein
MGLKGMQIAFLNGDTQDQDSSFQNLLNIGYSKSPNSFSIVNRIATMQSQIDWQIFRGEKLVEDVKDPVWKLWNQPNTFYTGTEQRKEFYSFLLLLGNSYLYTPRLKGGNHKGTIQEKFGLRNIPSQDVTPITGRWHDEKLIKHYEIEDYIKQNEKGVYDDEEIFHVQWFNPNYKEGKMPIGLSPIQVAKDIVLQLSASNDIQTKAFSNGMPPGILTRPHIVDQDPSKAQTGGLAKAWRRKYGRNKKVHEPIFTYGGVEFIALGYENLKDLNIIESDENGLRILCNVWNVPSILFNDAKGVTFSNKEEARKEIWTNRLIPDSIMYADKWTQDIAVHYGDYHVIPNFSRIPELQEDKKDLMIWLKDMFMSGSITPNQIRERMGFDEGDDDALNEYYLPQGMIPVDIELETEKFYNREGIQDYKSLIKGGIAKGPMWNNDKIHDHIMPLDKLKDLLK